MTPRITKFLITAFLIYFTFISAASAKTNEFSFATPGNKVFKTKLVTEEDGTSKSILISFDIAKGHYLYKDKIVVETMPENKLKYDLILPPAAVKHDVGRGDIEIYRNHVFFRVKITETNTDKIILKLKYHGCTDNGICYAPAKELWHLDLSTMKVKGINRLPAVNSFEAYLNNDNIIWSMINFYVLGLLISFGPCSLPLLPILFGIILSDKKKLNTETAFKLSLVYVISMAMTYSITGMMSAIIGSSLQQYLQTPLILVGFSAIILLLAAVQFEVINFKFDNPLSGLLNDHHLHAEESTYWGIAIMGILATLIASPCLSVPLIGVLTHITQTGNVQQGGLALFALGIGIGSPFILIGTLIGKYFPKKAYLVKPINKVLGFLLVALSLWIFQRIVPYKVSGAIWAVYFIGTGVYFIYSNRKNRKSRKLFQEVIGIIISLYGLVIAGSYNNPNIEPANPIHTITTIADASYYNNEPIRCTAIYGFEELKVKLRAASAEGKPVMLIFSSNWCATCSKIESYVLSGPYIKQSLKDFLILKADISEINQTNLRLTKIFDILTMPVVIFYDANGVKETELTLIGNFNRKDMLNALSKVKRKPDLEVSKD